MQPRQPDSRHRTLVADVPGGLTSAATYAELGRTLFVGTAAEGEQLRAAAGAGPWSIERAGTVDAALSALGRGPVDLLMVSGRTIPGAGRLLDGAGHRWPAVTLVTVGGPAVGGSQSLALEWPPDPDRLVGILFLLARSRGVLRRNATAWLASHTDELPGLPEIWHELTRYLDFPDRSGVGAARIVSRDVALSAQVLRLANSPWAGIGRHVGRIDEAVILVGLSNLRGLVYSASVAAMFARATSAGLSLSQFCDHGIACAITARRIAEGRPWVEEAFTAALLADVGELAMGQFAPDVVAAIRRRAASDGTSLLDAEARAVGFTHSEVGAELLRLWKLDGLIVEAVAHHHDPDPPGRTLDLATTVALARLVVVASGDSLGELEPPEVGRLDDWAQQLGMANRVGSWLGPPAAGWAAS